MNEIERVQYGVRGLLVLALSMAILVLLLTR